MQMLIEELKKTPQLRNSVLMRQKHDLYLPQKSPESVEKKREKMRVCPKERAEEVTTLTERKEGPFLLNPVKIIKFRVLPGREKSIQNKAKIWPIAK